MRATVVVLFAVALAIFGLSGGVLAQDEAPPEATADAALAETPTTDEGPETIDEGAYGTEPLEMAQEEPVPTCTPETCLDGGNATVVPCADPSSQCEETPEPVPTCSPETCLDGRNATVVPCADPASECEEPTTEPCTDETCLPPGTANSDCGTFPDPAWQQEALDSGIGDSAVFDPDGDGIACNHDDEPVDDGSSEPTTTINEPTTGGDDAGAASVTIDTGGEAANNTTSDDDSVTLPSTGVGFTAPGSLGGWGWFVSAMAVAVGGVAYGLRRRLT